MLPICQQSISFIDTPSWFSGLAVGLLVTYIAFYGVCNQIYGEGNNPWLTFKFIYELIKEAFKQ